MTADAAGVSERERLALAVLAHLKSLNDGKYESPHVSGDLSGDVFVHGLIDLQRFADAILDAGHARTN